MINISWDMLIPLKENLTSEPELEEIKQYGEYLGLILPQDNKYLQIAKEGLKANLPKDWEPCYIKGDQQNVYFRNIVTKQIQEQNPLDEIYKHKLKQIKRREILYRADPIKQESMVNQSSGIHLRASQTQNLKVSQLNNRKIFQQNITQESIYSEQQSPTESLMNSKLIKNSRLVINSKSFINPQLQISNSIEKNTEKKSERQWLKLHQFKIAEIQGRILRFIPDKSDLITSLPEIQYRQSEDLKNILNLDELKKLVQISELLIQKKQKLNALQKERRKIEKTFQSLSQHYNDS